MRALEVPRVDALGQRVEREQRLDRGDRGAGGLVVVVVLVGTPNSTIVGLVSCHCVAERADLADEHAPPPDREPTARATR